MKILSKTSLVGLSAAAFMVATAPASATETIDCTGTSADTDGDSDDDNRNNGGTDPESCTFGNDDPAGNTGNSNNFSDLYTFTLTYARTLSGDIFSSYADGDLTQNVDFSQVRLQGDGLGRPLSFDINSLGQVEDRSISGVVLQPGTYQLRVRGSSNANGSYSGNLFFGSVPEPAAWMMMILGFGVIGGAMRRRKEQLRGGQRALAA